MPQTLDAASDLADVNSLISALGPFLPVAIAVGGLLRSWLLNWVQAGQSKPAGRPKNLLPGQARPTYSMG